MGSRFVEALAQAGAIGEGGGSMLCVALALAAGGFPVFPCGANKAPLVARGFKARSGDESRVREWWAQFPEALPGIVPADGGLAALDVDSADAARATTDAGVSLTEGFLVATGGTSKPFTLDGQELPPMHVYLASDVEPKIRGVVSRFLDGYVIAPGARRNGRSYRVVHDGEPAAWQGGAPAGEPPQITEVDEPHLFRVRAAVNAIPNRADTDRVAYVRRAHMIKAAAGEAGRPIFLDWAARWEGGVVDPAEDARVWDTLGQSTVDRFALFHLAARHGFDDRPERLAELQADFADSPQLGSAVVTDAARATPGPRPLPVKRFADVTPVAIDWLLPGRLARQQITMINGWPGEGKTSLVIDIAARLSQGQELPDGTRPPRPLRVLYLATEDSESVLLLRLKAAGADLNRVLTIPDTEVEHLTLPSHQARLVEVLEQHDIDVLVVDPMKAFLDPELKDIAEQDARRFMLALRQVSEMANVAVICIRHPSKATASGHTTAISAASGSLGFTAAARIELLVGRMPDDDDTRALASVKNNLAAQPKALLFGIVSRDVLLVEDDGVVESVAAIEWRGVDEAIQADELLVRRSGREERTKLEEAKEFLRSILADGPMDHRTIRRAAKSYDIRTRTLERAREQIGWTRIEGNLRVGGRQVWGLNEHEHDATAPPAAAQTPDEALEPASLSDLLDGRPGLVATGSSAPEGGELGGGLPTARGRAPSQLATLAK